MRHLVCNVAYSVVPNNSPLLTIALHCSIITTSVYKKVKVKLVLEQAMKAKRV